MKKNVLFLFVISFALFLGTCNDPSGSTGGDEGEEVIITVGSLYELANSTTYPGAELDLSGKNLLDISKYASVTVDATLYSDVAGETLAVKGSASDSLAQFKLLKGTGDWDGAGNICGPTKYNMEVNGETIMSITDGASGVPAVLLLQANWEEFPGAVKSIKVNTITFTPKSSGDEVVFDWGSVTTILFPSSGQGEYPGAALPLDGAVTITGTLGDMALYKEVIVDAVVLDRSGNPFAETGKTPIDPAFFTLTSSESNWQNTEIVKQYDMAVNGKTPVTPDTNKVSEEKRNRWSGTPTHIVFQGKYQSGAPDDTMVGYVRLKTITFVPK
jgi:hypothetical protein